MVAQTDQWGKDPAVQRMRILFSAMEDVFRLWVGRAAITPFDPRLPGIRLAARDLFESILPRTMTRNRWPEAAAAADLYRACLAAAMARHGVTAPADMRPDDQRIDGMIREALP